MILDNFHIRSCYADTDAAGVIHHARYLEFFERSRTEWLERPGAGPTELRFIWPAPGKVLEGFSEPRNMGIAIDGQPGDPILAAADGKVIFSGVGPRGYGNLIIVKHENDVLSVYGHNRALMVREGDQVARGQKIAELGDSDADRPKLRFEIRREGKPVDPSRYLPAR